MLIFFRRTWHLYFAPHLYSAFQLCILSEVRLLNFLRLYVYILKIVLHYYSISTDIYIYIPTYIYIHTLNYCTTAYTLYKERQRERERERIQIHVNIEEHQAYIPLGVCATTFAAVERECFRSTATQEDNHPSRHQWVPWPSSRRRRIHDSLRFPCHLNLGFTEFCQNASGSFGSFLSFGKGGSWPTQERSWCNGDGLPTRLRILPDTHAWIWFWCFGFCFLYASLALGQATRKS